MFCKRYSRSQSTVFICFQVCVSKIYIPVYIVYTHIYFFENVLSSSVGLAVPIWTIVSTDLFVGILFFFCSELISFWIVPTCLWAKTWTSNSSKQSALIMQIIVDNGCIYSVQFLVISKAFFFCSSFCNNFFITLVFWLLIFF